MHEGVYGGARRWTEGCVVDRVYRGMQRVHGGMYRCVIGGVEGVWRCAEVHGGVQTGTEIGRGVQRCTEVCVSVWSSERYMGGMVSTSMPFALMAS